MNPFLTRWSTEFRSPDSQNPSDKNNSLPNGVSWSIKNSSMRQTRIDFFNLDIREMALQWTESRQLNLKRFAKEPWKTRTSLILVTRITNLSFLDGGSTKLSMQRFCATLVLCSFIWLDLPSQTANCQTKTKNISRDCTLRFEHEISSLIPQFPYGFF